MSPRARKSRDTQPAAARIGLKYWVARAIEELAKAGSDLESEPVHDLRVAVRRCRSMAEGLRSIDPSPRWKPFRALPKPLFSALGALRDTQVLQEWLAQLTAAEDGARRVIGAALTARAEAQKQAARAALQEFNANRWLKLADGLERRARRLPPDSLVFQYLALERWQEAFELHPIAMRTRRAENLHELRIGLKRFRYTVENFLPQHHQEWGKDLKHMQDLLGEVHDLDVFLEEIRGIAAGELRARIRTERSNRIAEYQGRTTGAGSLWTTWREGLPRGRQLTCAINAKLRHWARGNDPDPARSRRVARVSVKLWQGLRRELGWPADPRTPALLRTAALLHDVGAGKRRKKQATVRARVLRKLALPIGWREEEMRVVRLVSRYGVDGVVSANDEEFRLVSPLRQQQVMRLAGILRLAQGLESGAIVGRELPVRWAGHAVTVSIEGYDPTSAQAAELAAARHLLEVALGLPILIRPMQPAPAKVLSARAASA